MKEHRIDRLFDRFRRKGDTGALARVFDATAADLLALAVHLAGDLGTAEDLVQRTFLTAIEKKGVYDAGRRLMPWLVGILVRHAHAERRRRGRDGGGVAGEGEPAGGLDPAQAADGQELFERLEAALAELPSKYREVLEPHLLHGERAVDIARASGRPSATVRVQIRRGLERLRRALPAGLALGAGVVLGGRGLAEVRGRVLERAALGAAPAGLAVSTPTLVGGWLAASKAPLFVVSLLLLGFVGWAVRGSLLDRPVRSGATRIAGAAPGAARIATGGDRGATALVPGPGSSQRRAFSTPSSENAIGRSLSAITGRVTDAKGHSLAGLAVSLLQVYGGRIDTPAEDTTTDLGHRERDSEFLVDLAFTASDGSFELVGARSVAMHALLLDPGGAHAAMRFVDQALRSGKRTDVGTIVVEARREVRGRILDARGRPVEGARIRAEDLPGSVLGLFELRPGSQLLLPDSEGRGVLVQLPGHLTKLLDHLPFPETMSGPDGGFLLPGVPVGETRLAIDSKLLGLFTEPLAAEILDAGELAFPARQSIVGRVVDAAGAQVAGAEVVAGVFHSVSETDADYAVVSWSATTGQGGGFAFEATRDPSALLFGVRCGPGSSWTIQKLSESGVLGLPAVHAFSVVLRDRSGEPIENASLSLLPGPRSLGLEFFGMRPSGIVRMRSEGEGRYRVEGLDADRWRVRMVAAGFAQTQEDVDLEGRDQTREFVLDRSEDREIEVIDLETGLPIEGVRVVLADGEKLGRLLVRGVTDGLGHASLGGVPVEGTHALRLRLSHPGYAGRGLALDPKDETTRAALSAKEGVEFRLSRGGSVPREPLLVMLGTIDVDGSDAFVRLHGASDEEGRVFFGRLSAGRWHYEVYPRILDRTLVRQEITGQGRAAFASGSFVIEPGKQSIVPVDLPVEAGCGPGTQVTGSLEGGVKIEGADPMGLRVVLGSEEDRIGTTGWAAVSSDGGFFLDDIEAGEYILAVLRGDPGNGWSLDTTDQDILAARQVVIEGGHVTRIHIDLHPLEVNLRVLSESGEVVEDAEVHVVAMGGEGRGSHSYARRVSGGGLRLRVPEPGAYWFFSKSPTSGVASSEMNITREADQTLEIHLVLGVPCAGKVLLPEPYLDTSGILWMSVTSVRPESSSSSIQGEFQDGVGSFDFQGLVPGPCYFSVFLDGGQVSLDAQFTLPEGGSRSLVLHPAEHRGVAIQAVVGSDPPSEQ